MLSASLQNFFDRASSRLSIKINLLIMMGFALLVMIPSLVLTKSFTNTIKHEARQSRERVTEMFASLCADALARQSYGQLTYNAQSLMESVNVAEVVIFDRDGDRVTPAMHKDTPAESIYEVSRDVVVKNFNSGTVGRVVISFDMHDVDTHSRQLFWILGLSILVGEGVIIAVLSIILNRMISRPVKRMLTSVQGIAKGNLNHMIPVESNDELGNLAISINAMSQSLDASLQARRQAETNLSILNRELEEKVLERTVKLAEKAVELNKLNRRLKELDDAKSSMLSQVSHELRTPLTSILGFNKLITRDLTKVANSGDLNELEKVQDRLFENLHIIEQEGLRLTRLINDSLDLDKIESGNMQWNDEDVELSKLIHQTVAVAQGAFYSKKDVELYCTAPEDLPVLRVDQDRFIQVLTNLLNNAAKFTFEGSVTVSAEAEDDSVLISVCDTGVGIKANELSRVFEKFGQASYDDQACPFPKGTGLGLAISKEIVEYYGGSIWVESEHGRGSCFNIRMPVARPGAQAKDTDSAQI